MYKSTYPAPHIEEFIDSRWDYLSNKLNLTKPYSRLWLNNVIKVNYNSSTRIYHNLHHIVDCLSVSEAFFGSYITIEQEIALWFHDIVYDPLSNTNEEDSLALASMFLLNNTKYIDKVIYFILHTKHNANSYEVAGKDIQLAHFLDIDLFILGQKWDYYESYYKSVQEEYLNANVKPGRYRKGRIEFLESMLAKPNIYHTIWVEDKYGIQAKTNMAKEIEIHKAT